MASWLNAAIHEKQYASEGGLPVELDAFVIPSHGQVFATAVPLKCEHVELYRIWCMSHASLRPWPCVYLKVIFV